MSSPKGSLQERQAGLPNCAGSVAAEFALVAPVVILIAIGVADFGMLAARSAALAATTRIGAEFARLHPLDTNGIRNSMQGAMSFAPALTFPASFPRTCECDDTTPIACTESVPQSVALAPIASLSGSVQAKLSPRWCLGRECRRP